MANDFGLTHTFLTGESGVGKSTLLRRYLAARRLVADGFVTHWAGDRLYLSPFGDEETRFWLATKVGGRAQPVPDVTAVFDGPGVEILRSCGARDVIVMDEVGRFEARAARFQAAIMERVAGGVPIIGVLKQLRSSGSSSVSADQSIIDRISNHPSVVVFTVTLQNRDSILEQLI